VPNLGAIVRPIKPGKGARDRTICCPLEIGDSDYPYGDEGGTAPE
jgi:hypothetical protein